ncbi:MAG: toxic anion resistance protein [Solibacillus sp.]
MMHNPYTAFKATNRQEASTAYEQFAVHAESATPLFLSLSKFQQSRALSLASELAATDYASILAFGQQEQEQLKKFSTDLLYQMQLRDTGTVRTVLHDLIEQLGQIEPDDFQSEERGLLKRLFARKKQSMQETMTHYNKLSKRIDRLGIQLTHAQQDLLKDLTFLGKLYEHNETYFHDINVLIAALEIKKQHMEENFTLKDDVFGQAVHDWQMQMEWLDRRIYDLELSREIAIQFAPQIRLTEQTNQLLVDKIQTSLLTTIPLWQSQIAMLLSLHRQQRTMQTEERMLQAQQQMQDKNRATFKQASVSTKQQIDSLKQTQQQLLAALSDTLAAEQTLEKSRQKNRP